jgi:hypothetical protein
VSRVAAVAASRNSTFNWRDETEVGVSHLDT